MAIYTITREKIDTVIDDLLRKYPKGAKGKLDKSNYETTWDYRPSTNQYTNIIVCNDRNFGWDPDLLYRVLYHVNQNGSFRSYLRSRDETAGYKAISRRENRLQDRFYEVKRQWERCQDDAIWSVRVASGVEVHVITSSEKSAELLGKTVAAGAGLIGLDSDSRIWARKAAPADNKVLMSLRVAQIKNITSSIQRNAEKIEELKQHSANLMELCVSLQEFNSVVEGE